jgi:cell division protein ZapB
MLASGRTVFSAFFGHLPITARQPVLIDQKTAPNYPVAMDSLEQATKDLERLESQLRKLLEQVRKLREENESLQARQESLVAERATLVSKNDEARSKVEAMIHRLKALEQF